MRVDIGAIRRNQIIEAAIGIIAKQGIEHLSLSEIEKRARMSRGQLTYYFRTKEKILLAVFDRLLALMYQRLADADDAPPADLGGWEMTRRLLNTVLAKPPVEPEFHSLQYTFLSQIGHRADFRVRLAGLYEEWRAHTARGLDRDRRARVRPIPSRAMASLVQAILHGLSIQLVADPTAFDREQMLELCLDLLGNYLGVKTKNPISNARKKLERRRRPARPKKVHNAR